MHGTTTEITAYQFHFAALYYHTVTNYLQTADQFMINFKQAPYYKNHITLTYKQQHTAKMPRFHCVVRF